MWTEEHRRTYRREGEGYPSDLRDAEWARLEPLIPGRNPAGDDVSTCAVHRDPAERPGNCSAWSDVEAGWPPVHRRRLPREGSWWGLAPWANRVPRG